MVENGYLEILDLMTDVDEFYDKADFRELLKEIMCVCYKNTTIEEITKKELVDHDQVTN